MIFDSNNIQISYIATFQHMILSDVKIYLYMSLNVCLIMGPFKICKNIYVKPIKDGVCIFVLKYFYDKTYQYNYLICKFILTEIFLTWPFAAAVNVWHRFSSSNR